MAERLKVPTPSRRMGAQAAAAVLSRLHRDSEAEDVLADVIHGEYPGGTALVSSFGAESAVLLHMISRIAPDLPVLFLETGMLFPATLAYQQRLARELGLRDVRLIRPDPEELAEDDPLGELHSYAPDACCHLRKTLPLRRALAPFEAWISGRKRFQTTERSAIEVFEVEQDTGRARLKVNPLASWSATRLRAYMARHTLPAHPLVARGYLSTGCMPCTSPVKPGEDPRAGRWRGRAKAECGIHIDAGVVRRPAGHPASPPPR
ncbi:MAG: phosphoadenylyl-sulfate reductase [Pseudomonadota bacterium]